MGYGRDRVQHKQHDPKSIGPRARAIHVYKNNVRRIFQFSGYCFYSQIHTYFERAYDTPGSHLRTLSTDTALFFRPFRHFFLSNLQYLAVWYVQKSTANFIA